MVVIHTDDIDSDLRWLLGAVARGLSHSGGDAVVPALRSMASYDLAGAALVPPPPHPIAATSQLAPAIAEAVLHQPDVAAALAALSDHLHWQEMADGVGLAQLVGPQGFIAGQAHQLDILLLTPAARHSLPAVANALWWPLTGPSRWLNGSDVTVKPGDVMAAAGDAAPTIIAGRLPLLGLWLGTGQ